MLTRIHRWLRRMQFLCGLFVRVCLDTQGLVYGEDFEEEGKVALNRCGELARNLISNEMWVGSQGLLEV
jgi:hypothetical protein